MALPILRRHHADRTNGDRSEVDEDKVTASLADGVLTVRVPKTERARQRKIPINTG